MKFDEKNTKKIKSPFLISMATAAKFVQPIPIFLAYLIPLDVDVVPIEFHLFLFIPTMFHEEIFFLNPPSFISMATAVKFVLPIPIYFLVYLVPIDV